MWPIWLSKYELNKDNDNKYAKVEAGKNTFFWFFFFGRGGGDKIMLVCGSVHFRLFRQKPGPSVCLARSIPHRCTTNHRFFSLSIKSAQISALIVWITPRRFLCLCSLKTCLMFLKFTFIPKASHLYVLILFSPHCFRIRYTRKCIFAWVLQITFIWQANDKILHRN